jgi:uroporphyrinogen-III decarboxylase
MFEYNDDVASQRGLFVSPEMWRRLVKPRMARFCDLIRSRGARVRYHCCGSVRAIIPDLIEIGLDVLNPIQPACMNPAELGQKYGDKLCFWGSMDEQYTLPFGNTEDVRNEVLTRLRTIGKNGGLILGPTHHVQLDTPMENFWAMVNSITQTPYVSLD